MNKQPTLKIVVAGDKREEITKKYSPSIWTTLAENEFVNRNSVQCVGFCRNLVTDELIVVFPKAFASDRTKLELHTLSYTYSLIRTFNKVSKETAHKKEIITSNQQTKRLADGIDPVLNSLDAALRLQKEFRQNGPYFKKEPRLVQSDYSHPIHWQKTLQRSTPVISENGIFFSPTYHKSHKLDLLHPLSVLHYSVLQKVYQLLGDRFPSELFQGVSQQPLDTKEKVNRLLDRLNHQVFDDRGQFIIKAIRAYLGDRRFETNKTPEQNRLLVYSADFENIWEHILRKQFSSTIPKLKRGKWVPREPQPKPKGIKPRLDGYVSTPTTDIIYDAKDYRIRNGEKVIGSASDHYKQIIYQQLLQESQKEKQFVNVLLFPTFGSEKLFTIRGHHHFPEIEHSRVFEVLVDYERVVQSWLGEKPLNRDEEIAKLLQELQNGVLDP